MKFEDLIIGLFATIFILLIVAVIGSPFYLHAVVNGRDLPCPQRLERFYEKLTMYNHDHKIALEHEDFVVAHKLLDKRLNKVRGKDPATSYNRRMQYYTAMEDIYYAELTYILLNDIEDASDRLVFILNEIPELYDCPKGLVENTFLNDYTSSARLVNEFHSNVNKLCDRVLTVAINRQNREFAENLLGFYRDDVTFIPGGRDVYIGEALLDKKHAYILWTQDSKEAAVARFNEAFKNK